ncbi:TldD/PmbA family protein [Acidisphaera rubrifaciens]|uniref:Zn-dependent microcin-processing peptidase U62/PmbA/TldD n=1 Tax=Acidisphaera rubrifaciens HS-AP3 TaxID=1231350 RepID=A0A0D6P4H8_9PROT|nr:TldD/PmbA family protein [Acidisphaera rubrifaciens]GAN76582.1 Zn-dependent microcin-processing peptidase U62/PmbA/TldD [Acidisphaera rubrifaciens HS-AP3]
MNPIDLVQSLLGAAKRAGADAADAVFVSGASLSVQRRLGKTEHVERSEGRDLGLRVFVGQRAAIVSSSTTDPAGFAALAERAVAMARVVPEDPYACLFDPVAVEDPATLDIADGVEPDAAALTERAAAAEDAALSVAGITNTEGSEAGFGRSEAVLATSAGFVGRTVRSSHSVSATAIAGTGTAMQRDYDFHTAIYLADLEDAASIGLRAAERALARMNPTRPRTARVPVVLDPRVSSSMLGHLAGAINGASVTRGTTFLKDALGTRVMSAGIHIHDDPRRRRGLRSRTYDGEGVPTVPRAIIEDGVLTTWMLDLRSAKQLGLQSTGHAARGTGGPPSPAPTNLYMAAGHVTPAALMADIKLGLYVTEMIGMGVNGITGDYSRGAAGFMIRDGVLAEPVAEITIAGNLRDMFLALTPANDLVFRRGTDAPTLRIDGMTMAGA